MRSNHRPRWDGHREIARLADKVAKLSLRSHGQTSRSPRLSRPHALPAKNLRESLTERPVETGIVGDDEVGGLGSGFQRRQIDLLARNHRIGDARQLADSEGIVTVGCCIPP